MATNNGNHSVNKDFVIKVRDCKVELVQRDNFDGKVNEIGIYAKEEALTIANHLKQWALNQGVPDSTFPPEAKYAEFNGLENEWTGEWWTGYPTGYEEGWDFYIVELD